MPDLRIRRPDGGRFSWVLVYSLGRRWRWHAHTETRRTPPRSYANAGGWSRWKITARLRGRLAWLRLEAKRVAKNEKEG